MHTFVQLGDLVVNLSNVVALDIDGITLKRIWYTGSPTPVEIQSPGVDARGLIKFLNDRGFLAA
jgi:hypothetical protein